MKAPPQHSASWPPPLCTGHKPSLVPLPEVQENTGISNFYLHIVAAGWRSSCSLARTTQAMVPHIHRHCSCGKAKLPIRNMMAAHRRCCVPPPCPPHRRGELRGFSSYVTRKKNILKLSNSYLPRLSALGGCLMTSKHVMAFQWGAIHQLSSLAPNTR